MDYAIVGDCVLNGKMVDGIRFTIPQQDEQQQQAAPINVDDTDVPF